MLDLTNRMCYLPKFCQIGKTWRLKMFIEPIFWLKKNSIYWLLQKSWRCWEGLVGGLKPWHPYDSKYGKSQMWLTPYIRHTSIQQLVIWLILISLQKCFLLLFFIVIKTWYYLWNLFFSARDIRTGSLQGAVK